MSEKIKHLENPFGPIPRPKSEVFDGHMTFEVLSFAHISEPAITVNDADV